MGNQNAHDDILQYRNGYPNQVDNPNENDNINFYKNQLASNPSGDLIDNIHANWHGNWRLLEDHHGYIQWLFPIREHGMNSQSTPLQAHEITLFLQDPECGKRLIKSYKLMLDFYGMKLKNEETGEVERADHWKGRYNHLNSSFHNYLRITRMLKCLGELGYESWKKHWIDLFIQEIYENKVLMNCSKSMKLFWVETLKDDNERRERVKRIRRLLGEPSSSEEEDEDDNDDDDDDDDDDDKDTKKPTIIKKNPVVEKEKSDMSVVSNASASTQPMDLDKSKDENDNEESDEKYNRYMKMIESSDDDEKEDQGAGEEDEDDKPKANEEKKEKKDDEKPKSDDGKETKGSAEQEEKK